MRSASPRFQKVDGQWWVSHVHGSTPDHRLHVGEYMLRAQERLQNHKLEHEVAERTAELQRANQITDDLLRNILPASVVEKLRSKASAKDRPHPNATKLFANFKDYTQHSERFLTQQLVDDLNVRFTTFDRMLVY